MKTKTEDERVQHLKSLGINPDGAALAALPPDPAEPAKPVHQPAKNEPTLAPPGIDPRTMPVDQIEFDPSLLDEFPSLEGEGMAAASRKVFALYKSYVKGDPRNSALHRRIGAFIRETRFSRRPAGDFVKEQVKATAEERDVAKVIAASGVTADDLAEALQMLAEKRSQ